VTRSGAPTSSVQDASSYDGVAEAFDRFSDRFSTPLASRLLEAARVAPSDHVLDVGTGTGVVALHAAPKVGPEGRVLGIDISEEMLGTARAKASRRFQADRVEFRRMDAQALDLPDASFDVVVSLFAVHHLPDPPAAFRQMHRVLRPGGRLAVAAGSGPPLFSLSAVVRAAQRVPETIRRLRGRELTAPGFLDELVRRRLPAIVSHPGAHHHETSNLPALVREAGFTGVESFWEGHHFVLDTPAEFWELQRTYSTLARERLAGASADDVRSLREEVLETSGRVQSRGGRLVYRHAALFVTARRPAQPHA